MPWTLSRHAMVRMVEMGVSRRQVLDVINEANVDYPDPREPDCRVASLGDLAVVYNPHRKIILTVLWHGEVYERGRASAKTEKRALETARKKGRL